MIEGGTKRWAVVTRWASVTLLSVSIAVMLIARLKHVTPTVLPFLQQAADSSIYAADFYINAAIVGSSSPIFPLLEFLSFDITHAAATVPLYILCSVFAGWAVYLILTGPLRVESRIQALALLFLAIFADEKFLEYDYASWICEHNFSFTMFGRMCRIWLVYWALTGRSSLMAAMLIPINIITFKVGWPLVLIVAVLMLWRRERSPWPWVLLLVSIVVPVWSAVSGRVDLTTNEARYVLETLRAAYPIEDDPTAVSGASLLLFTAGTGFLWWRAGTYERGVRDALRCIVAVSLAIFFGGGAYLALSAFLPPIPAIVLLSPVRAMETVSFAVYLVALVEITRARSLKATEKVPLLLALALLKVTAALTWVALAGALALLAGLVWVVRTRADGRWPLVGRLSAGLSTPLLIGIAAPVLASALMFDVMGVRNGYVYQQGLGFRDATIPADAAQMLLTIRRENEDRRRVFVRPVGDRWEAAEWNAYARSSGIAGDPYYLPHPGLIERQQRMNALIDRLASELGAGRVSAILAAGMAECHAFVVAPNDAAEKLPGWTVVRAYGAWTEFRPPAAIAMPTGVCATQAAQRQTEFQT